jgi:hypothetical protein
MMEFVVSLLFGCVFFAIGTLALRWFEYELGKRAEGWMNENLARIAPGLSELQTRKEDEQ